MPITTQPASHDAEAWSQDFGPRPVLEDLSLLLYSCSSEADKYFDGDAIATSFDIGEEDGVYSFPNGFVQGAVEAYSKHYHLVIRPEDVWFSVLTQLSFYINAHSEELRGKFVAHKGQIELEAVQIATLRSADYGKLSYEMGKLMQQKFVDPDLREWFLPAFSTTNKQDQVVASVIMMGAMQDYFKYTFSLRCGLPSVTLLGVKSDWDKLLGRLEKLPTLGTEPGLWYTLLKPVVNGFVETFKSPDSAATKDFWQKIAHHSGGGSGPSYLSGWITAFCFWSDKGVPLHIPGNNPPEDLISMATWFGRATPVLILDGVKYHRVDTQHIPAGWACVPVTVDDNGTLHDTRMVAGSVGVTVTSKISGGDLNTVQPLTGWWIYKTKAHYEKKAQYKKKAYYRDEIDPEDY